MNTMGINLVWQKISSTKLSYGYAIFIAIFSCLLGVLIPGKWALPILNTLGIYPLFSYQIRHQQYRRALIQMLVWAVVMSIVVILLSTYFNPMMESKIIRGKQYRDEMVTWVKTGVGEESTPNQFIPKHLMHLVAFSLLTIITGGFAALFMGAVLLNYMNFYVGSLYAHTTNPLIVLIFGWQPWAIIRVIGYIALAIGLSELFFSFLNKRPLNKIAVKNYVLGGFFCIILDLFLKTILAPTWQKVLQTAIK
ncbi:MAG: hypothetical protein ACE14V_15915 [bacterium]